MDNEEKLYITSRKRTEDGKYSIAFNNGCVEIFSDEEVMEHYLYEDSVPLKITYVQLTKAVKKKRAIAAIISYVAFTLRTEKQAEDKLLRLGYDAGTAEDAIEYLRSKDYLNDSEYARKYVNTALKTKIISRKMCEYELIRKGIPEDMAVEAAEKIDDRAQASKLLNKKMKTQKDRLKLKKFMYAKGFTAETINELLGEETY